MKTPKPKSRKSDIHKLICLEYMNNGLNKVQAYLKYHPNIPYESARTEAGKYFAKPVVKEELEKLQKEYTDLYEIKREKIIAELQSIVNETKLDTKTDRMHLLKALDMLNRMQGNYEQKIDITSAGEKLNTISIEVIKPKE